MPALAPVDSLPLPDAGAALSEDVGEAGDDVALDVVGADEAEERLDVTGFPVNFLGNSTTPTLFVQHEVPSSQHHLVTSLSSSKTL